MELPGFQIEPEFAPRGAGRVCLAWQQQPGRPVVLKFADEEGFGREAFRTGIAGVPGFAERRHQNIAEIYEAGACGAARFLVLEYIAGGDLTQKLAAGIRLAELVDVVRLIARALDYAHDQGFVHLDVRPRNILFRPDGSPVLSDFGNAWRMDAGQPPSLSAPGAGDPEYMSPEQAAGRPPDQRSDLYSLGAVVYKVLTGDSPQPPESGTPSAARRPQDRPHRLPSQLRALQPVVDRALARDPGQRFPRGADLAAALQEAGSGPSLAGARFKSDAVTVDEIQAVVGDLFSSPADPARQEHSARRQRRAARRMAMGILLVAATGMGAAYLVNVRPLWFNTMLAEVGLAEDPLLQTAWIDAQSLHQDPNQSLSAIVAGYRRVLALESENKGAQDAIAGLAEQWRASVMESLSQFDIAQAETKLDEMFAAFPNDSALTDLQRQLADRKTAEALLASTQALLRSHGPSDVPSATAAIQAYHEIMRLAPEHPEAQLELTALAEHYGGLAREAAERGDVQDAISFLERAIAADGELPVLADVRAEIQQAATAQNAIEELLQQASGYRVRGLLVTPQGENAAELYNRVLATAPDNVLARQGLSEVTSQLLNQAVRMLEEDDIAGVQSLVDHASAAGIDADAMLEIRTRLGARLTALAAIDGNLLEARALLRQGFVTEPPEQNAVSLLREVERLDPGNEQAQVLLAQAAARLVEVAKEARAAGLSEEARQYLDLALTVTPDAPQWRTLRESWE